MVGLKPSALPKQLIHLCHHAERISHIDYVGFAASPAAVGVERNCPSLADEPPANDVRFLAWHRSTDPWRGVEPVCPTWFICVRKGSTGCPSPPWSTSDFELPSERRSCRKPRIKSPASAACACPSGCFLVQPAPATKASPLLAESSVLPAQARAFPSPSCATQANYGATGSN